MRRNCVDSRAAEQSYIGGASTANQRIENWWGVMRKEGIEYWIQLLGELKDQGLLTGDFLDKALSQLFHEHHSGMLTTDRQGRNHVHHDFETLTTCFIIFI